MTPQGYDDEWHYLAPDGAQVGPVSIRDLSDLAGRGAIGPETPVWSSRDPRPVPAREISERLMAARAAASPAPAPPADPVIELKPPRGSFLFPRIFGGTLLALLLGGVTAGVLWALEMEPWPGAVAFAVVVGLSLVSSMVAYRKERYEIHGTRLLCHRGGLLSDQTTELDIRNITHVKMRLPWIRHRLFGIGHVQVESAGNAQPVILFAIRQPQVAYAALRERMQRNGYELTATEILHHEQPAKIGVLSECLGFIGGLVVISFPFASSIHRATEGTELDAPGSLLPIVLGAVALLLLIFATIRFLDFRRRTYRVYRDMVVYEEGFMTREHAFIPYENLADANTRRSIFDRIFGLHQVQISCQGTGREISFRHLRRGDELSAAIDRLVADAREKPKPARKDGPAGDTAAAHGGRPRRVEPPPLSLAETLVGEFRMNATRTLVPLLLLLPLFPLWVMAMIQAVIQVASTRYSVRPGSLRHSYRFITVQEREFAYDKITGLVIRQNLLDRLFGTMTLRFWSLGSGKPMEFANVHANQVDLPALMRQVGIPAPSLDPWRADTPFHFMVWLRARLGFLTLLLIFAAAALALGTWVEPAFHWLLLLPLLLAGCSCIHGRLHCDRQQLLFHDHHVEAARGVISRHRYFARYANIKRTCHTRYPGGTAGDLVVFVAGEEEVQSGPQKQGRQGMLRPCSFTIDYLSDARAAGLLLDDILCGRVQPAVHAVPAAPPAVLLESPRAVGNAVARLVIFSILLAPLIALLPLTLPLTVIRVKRWRYRVESARVVLARGILYRSETSILLDRIDSLQQSQGALNKMFRNGNVALMTAGSSRPDLELPDAPAYLDLYRTIRDHSQ